MAFVEIPDLNNWEIGANIAELDRGHKNSTVFARAA
jgi:hypothetical protein